ncbi:hypothetical protein Droror1_Dr00027290 [Drosera rotundifolia]
MRQACVSRLQWGFLEDCGREAIGALRGGFPGRFADFLDPNLDVGLAAATSTFSRLSLAIPVPGKPNPEAPSRSDDPNRHLRSKSGTPDPCRPFPWPSLISPSLVGASPTTSGHSLTIDASSLSLA